MAQMLPRMGKPLCFQAFRETPRLVGRPPAAEKDAAQVRKHGGALLNTILKPDAVRRLRHGVSWLGRDDILHIDGSPAPGETVALLDEKGRKLGFGDVDLQAEHAIRRIGLPDETPEGLLQRHLKNAFERRAILVEDPRYCRLVNEDGDGLPGLVVDRYDTHYVVQTSSRAMDARVEELARSLVDSVNARSVLLRNDGGERAAQGLPAARPHVLFGTPPRWTRVLEMGARFSVDLHEGQGTGFFYDQREIRRAVRRLSAGARVLDPCCYIGGLFVHAGLEGARQILAFDVSPEAAELARENAEANGIHGRTHVECADAFSALQDFHNEFDLVLLDSPDLPPSRAAENDPFVQLLRLCVRAARHGGRLVVAGYTEAVDERLGFACELEERVAFRVLRPGLPMDFPTLLGVPEQEGLHSVVVQLS
jgi:23S rRNA (cytosine1962-C5)-methyltransferase